MCEMSSHPRLCLLSTLDEQCQWVQSPCEDKRPRLWGLSLLLPPCTACLRHLRGPYCKHVLNSAVMPAESWRFFRCTVCSRTTAAAAQTSFPTIAHLHWSVRLTVLICWYRFYRWQAVSRCDVLHTCLSSSDVSNQLTRQRYTSYRRPQVGAAQVLC